MATKKTAPRNASAPALRPKKPSLVTVGSDVRKVHPWFDAQSGETIAEAVRAQRVKLRKGQPRLSASRLQQVLRAHERIQRELNVLSKRQERLTDRLKAHFGHTGETNLVSSEGNTLVSTSATLGINASDLRAYISEELWNRLIVSVLSPELLLAAAEDDIFLRAAIERSTHVAQLKVSVTAPSSRRPKSGKPEGE